MALSIGCSQNVTDSDVESQVEKVEQEEEKLAAMKVRQKYETEMESKLTALKTKVNELKSQAESAVGDKQVELSGEIAMLETKCLQMREKLDDLKAASGDLWASTKIKAEETWTDVSETVESKVKEWTGKIAEEVKPKTDDSKNDKK